MSSPVMASAWPCWSSTRHPVWFEAVTGMGPGIFFSWASDVVPVGAQTFLPLSSGSDRSA